jgi:hypothetical protein
MMIYFILHNRCFCNWNPSDWFSLFGLIISFFTLVLGFFAYKNFLLKQLREKQLQVVCDLINHINTEWNDFELKNVSNPFRMGGSNLFDIAEVSQVTEDTNFYTFSAENEDRFYPSRRIIDSGKYDPKDQTFNEIIFWDFFSFHNHPLLPISIARVLKKFSISSWSGEKNYGEVQKEDKYVVMGNKMQRDNRTRCLFYNDMRTWKEFVTLCKELKTVIIEWGKKNGLDDMNISHSHNFISNK